MTDIDGDPDGDVEMTEREQVEGIEYDNRLENQYQATLFQQTDKRTQLEKLRDGYTKNIAKLNKEQLRSLFRDAQKAGMKETFTQCKNMNKQQAAVLQFYIKEFHANGVDIKKAPIFNPRKQRTIVHKSKEKEPELKKLLKPLKQQLLPKHPIKAM